MSNHTPGPWTARENPCHTLKDVPQPWEVMDGGGYRVVGVPSTFNAEANARLIAAAPELLSALESLLEIEAETTDGAERVEKARAAIAKARGTSSP